MSNVESEYRRNYLVMIQGAMTEQDFARKVGVDNLTIYLWKAGTEAIDWDAVEKAFPGTKEVVEDTTLEGCIRAAGMKPEDVAKILGVTEHTVFAWEEGRSLPCKANESALRRLFPDMEQIASPERVAARRNGRGSGVRFHETVRIICMAEELTVEEFAEKAGVSTFSISSYSRDGWRKKENVIRRIAKAFPDFTSVYASSLTPEQVQKSFSSFLHQELRNAHLSQREIAEKAGVSCPTIRSWEGNVCPKFSRLDCCFPGISGRATRLFHILLSESRKDFESAPRKDFGKRKITRRKASYDAFRYGPFPEQKAIREIRIDSQMSQRELGANAKYSDSTISRWEYGRRQANWDSLEEALGMTKEQVLGHKRA